MNRRKLLALLGGSVTAAAAGCSGDDGGGDGDGDGNDTDGNDTDTGDGDGGTDGDGDDGTDEPEPASLDVSITGTSSPVDEGETVEVAVDVSNSGEETGEATVILEVNGGAVDNADVSVAGGATESVTLSWPTDETVIGTHEATVSIAGASDTTELVVEEVIDADVTVDVVSNAFEPNLIEIEPDDTVLWAHQEGSHTVTFYHEDNDRPHRVPEGVEALDESIASGDQVGYTFTEPGVYNYHCRPHEGQGMVGLVVVGQNDAPEQPGVTPVSGDIPDAAVSELENLISQAKEILGIPESLVHEVDLSVAEFSPSVIDMNTGDTIRWIVQDGSHTVSFYHEDVEVVVEEATEPDQEPVTEPRQHRVPEGVEAFDVEVSASGQAQVDFTPQTEGVYDYFCKPHESQGMVGTFVVGENDNPDQPGLQEPDDTIPQEAASKLRDLNVDGYDLSGIPVLSRVVTAANDTIETFNTADEDSLKVINDGLQENDDVPLIEPIGSATTREEADAAATHLREEATRVNDQVFTQVPKEINDRAPISGLVDPEKINSPQDARERADELEDTYGEQTVADVTEALRGAADIVEAIVEELNTYADQLEAAVILN